jgi:hypothetical protein
MFSRSATVVATATAPKAAIAVRASVVTATIGGTEKTAGPGIIVKV